MNHSSWIDAIKAYLEREAADRVTVQELMQQALALPPNDWTQLTRNEVGRIMRDLGWSYASFRFPSARKPTKGYMRRPEQAEASVKPSRKPGKTYGVIPASPGTRIAAPDLRSVIAWIITDGAPVPVLEDGPLRDVLWTLHTPP